MYRYALTIEYDGTNFHGWQIQKKLPTIQGAINFAIAKIQSSFEGITGAGRTDSGVHASGQVAHLELNKNWEPFRLQQALNFHLKPKPIAIIKVNRVVDDFHARFSAIERHYQFKIVNRDSPLTFQQNRYWLVKRKLNIRKMQKAANYLIGCHDFTTFRSSLCQAKSPVKTMKQIEIISTNTELWPSIEINIKAKSFLHNQVRSIVGTLEKVGSNTWEPEQVAAALVAKNRNECGPVAPPYGLYLAKVIYPQNLFKM